MKPARFAYLPARSPAEVIEALAEPTDVRVLAGGQSLVLDMNYRTARPSRLVDINRVTEFGLLDIVNGALRVGPLVRHRTFERPVAPGALGRLLAEAALHIAHPPIRARGTMLGSLAYAHPAAEWPAVAVAVDAVLDLTSAAGTRTVAATEFFTGPFITRRRPDELLARARLPLLPEGTGIGFVEHRRTHASFAQLAAVATLTVRDGLIAQARLALANAGGRPIRARAAEAMLTGRPAAVVSFAEAGHAAAYDDAQPRPQPYSDLPYQRHAITVLVRRALEDALDDAVPGDVAR